MLTTKNSVEQIIKLPEFERAGVEVFMKRDDLIHPFISGNKWRKLKYNYQRYQNEGYKGVLTFGGAYSNHLIAVAAFCAEAGIPCTGIIRGEEPEEWNPVLVLASLWGMKFHFVSRSDYRSGTLDLSSWTGSGYMVIPEGGNNQEGLRGCAEMVEELEREYDHIFCASGTGCTISGILQGVIRRGWKTRVHSVPILKDGGFIGDVVREYGLNAEQLEIHTDFHFGGYAKFDELLAGRIAVWAKQTGILTDPVYTGKMFYAMCDLIDRGVIAPGSRVLAVHTGGLTGLLSEKMRSIVQKSEK